MPSPLSYWCPQQLKFQRCSTFLAVYGHALMNVLLVSARSKAAPFSESRAPGPALISAMSLALL